MNGLDLKTKYFLTIEEIETSDLYELLLEDESNSEEKNHCLRMFNNAISILAKRLRNNDLEREFTEKEQDVLNFVFNAIEEFKMLNGILQLILL